MTDTSSTGTISDLFRRLGAVLNKGLYFLLASMYQVFFNVASAQLFENETIKNFYGRIQLIIGVFMIFKLTLSILQGIMDPDKFTNPKEGFGSIITRVIVALVMLTLIVPINIPNVENANSLEKYINNNGILFGALYSLQDRILTNNTLGRLILGTNDGMGDESTDQFETQNEKLVSSSNIFASTILKGFLRINLKPEGMRGEDDSETNQENWYCGNDVEEGSDNGNALAVYSQLDIDPSLLLSDDIIIADCSPGGSVPQTNGPLQAIGEFLTGDSVYLFVFEWLWALVVGAVFLVILVGFTVDIAIRSIKLSILRLLAPIPIISYIEPKSSKDGGMFSSWVSALTSTYLDLFLRLAIVYFVIFLIQDMIVNGIIINDASGMVGIISTIFIWIGLFFFAKMAPKFIKDALGLKGTMSNVGLSGMLGGAATLLGGGGLAGAGASMLSNMNAAAEAAGQGKAAPPAWQTGSDLAAQIKTGDPKAKGGIINNLNDHLMRQAGISRARKLYGVTASGVNEAKSAMFDAQDEAAIAHNMEDRAAQHGWDALTASEQAAIEANYRQKTNTAGPLSAAQMDELKYQGATMYASAKDSAYAKAKSNYEKASKFADSHRISPSFEEEHRGSARELGSNIYQAVRHPVQTAENYMNNRRGEHPSMGDRIAGNNRWSPGVQGGPDLSTMQDNPDTTINTPEAGGHGPHR